jgi:hypothetical protein
VLAEVQRYKTKYENMSGQLLTLGTLPRGRPPGTHQTEGWVGPTASLYAEEKKKSLVPTWN